MQMVPGRKIGKGDLCIVDVSHQLPDHTLEKLLRLENYGTDQGLKEQGGYAGENCAMVPTGGSSKDIARRLHKCWMGSTGHRQNILRPEFNQLGVGIVKRGRYYYATQLFKGSSFQGGQGKGIPVPCVRKSGLWRFLFWWITYSVAIGLSSQIIPQLGIKTGVFQSLLAGFIIQLVCQVAISIRYGRNVKFNNQFIKWVIIHSTLYFILNSVLSIGSGLSLGYTLIAYGVYSLSDKQTKRRKHNKRRRRRK